MFNMWKAVVLFAIITISGIIGSDAHPPQNSFDSNQALDVMETEGDKLQNSYVESALQQEYQRLYPNVPLEHLQMLIARYGLPIADLPAPSFAGVNQVYRVPESKRQVRYRQCYFNPISCFRK